MYQLGSRLNAAMQCDNILAEHPDWTRGPRRLRMPVWEDAAGDISAKIDHISPHSWEGDTWVAKVSTKTTWFGGRQISERELLEAGWEPPFKTMDETGGYNIFCPFGKHEMVLLGRRHDEERDEDDDDRDVPSPSTTAASKSPAPADPDTAFLPDLEDVAQETAANLESAAKAPEPYLVVPGSTTKQHKATILRIFSSRWSVADSRDRLKRVRGFSRHDAAVSTPANSNEAIPGESMMLVEDPAAILVRSNGFIWLAVVIISGISCGTKQVEMLPKRLLGEPNVRVKVQIMQLEPAQSSPESEEGDWEWTGKFVAVTESGVSRICEVDGSLVQLLNPAVLPARNLAKKGAATYHFKSVELVAITASMELGLSSTKKLPKIAFSSSFPYRTPAGFACFVCNRDGTSLEQEEGLCTLCPSAALSVASPAKLVTHMAIHMLFDQNPPINRESGPCGFCLSTNSFCTIVLIKSKGSDGAVRIDMARSRCPNLGNLGLATAANSSKKNPCTNRPLVCPISPCPDIVWKYNLKTHIQTVHPSAKVANYKSYYDLAQGEEIELKRISTTKKRKSSKKKINFRISPQHSTEVALGEFFRAPRDDGEDDSDNDEESINSSRSPSPVLAPEVPTLRALSPDEELPAVSALVASQQSTPISIAPVSATDAPPLSTVASIPGSAAPSDLSQPTSNVLAVNAEAADQEELAAPITRRSTRVSRKRRVVVSDDEAEEVGCSAPNCTITDDEPMVVCSGPACGSRAHLCCVGLETKPAEWYCDDSCLKNAGQTVRKKRRV
ncbi:hypothetical protein B0H10DRAFT_2096937 [Mycena sp. CBHHK59/15]|nr:hypothetical protein B0H10DRAFT_2096937 [Mycena sp. CBHHK59/15]